MERHTRVGWRAGTGQKKVSRFREPSVVGGGCCVAATDVVRTGLLLAMAEQKAQQVVRVARPIAAAPSWERSPNTMKETAQGMIGAGGEP